MKTRSTAILWLIALAGCSSVPSEIERYENLDYDTKTVFLTYYPYLSQDQRQELLSGPEGSPRELIQDWAGTFNDPRREVGSFDEMMNNPANRRLASLELKTDTPDLVTSGDHLAARAFATYSNGRTVEVTPDVEWRVEPHLGKMERNVLRYECVSSDLTITGNFLGEKEGSRRIQIRKPLEKLEMKISDSYVGEDSGYDFQLVLLAHCKDGTVSDVSCQASWRSQATGGKIEGCGNFSITSKEKLEQDALTVVAHYGDLSVRKTLRPPVR